MRARRRQTGQVKWYRGDFDADGQVVDSSRPGGAAHQSSDTSSSSRHSSTRVPGSVSAMTATLSFDGSSEDQAGLLHHENGEVKLTEGNNANGCKTRALAMRRRKHLFRNFQRWELT